MTLRLVNPPPRPHHHPDQEAGPRPDPLLDHLVYATPDLDATVAEFRAVTGLDPAVGGRHVGLGTRNALVGLGPSRYLEIVGPDPDSPPAAGAVMPFGIAALTAATLVTWAVHPRDIDAAVSACSAAGADLGAVATMQRARPDGVLLQWRLAQTWPPPLGGVVPFAIDWGASPHPATGDLPHGDLLAFGGTHPDAAAVRRVLDAIGVHLDVRAGAPGLSAVLGTPRGAVELR